MRKKIFFIVGSLGAGGSERVYWLLSQYFNSRLYDVSVVFLNANDKCFSMQIPGISFIDLKTVKASRSFFKLYKLIKQAKPFAVYSTTDHINILTGIVACFLKIPHLIARASNDPQAMKQFYGYKARFYNLFTRAIFHRFDTIVCQSDTMLKSIFKLYGTSPAKLKVISNPAYPSMFTKLSIQNAGYIRLITVGRLAKEKGLFRLLAVMKALPENYSLTIVGSGILMNDLKLYTTQNNLTARVNFKGQCDNIPQEICKHDLMVLTSFTEGFPNVLLESLSVGVPVVTFRVSGAKELIREGINGFIVEQDDLQQLKTTIMHAGSRAWQHKQIKADVCARFGLDTIGQLYENLLHN